MKYDEIEVRDSFSVFGLKDVFVDIQLKCVVPVVCVGEVFDGGVCCEFVGAVGFCDFAAALPVIDGQGGGGGGGVDGGVDGRLFNHFIYHIN